jgi:hypothetical protein
VGFFDLTIEERRLGWARRCVDGGDVARGADASCDGFCDAGYIAHGAISNVDCGGGARVDFFGTCGG